MEKYISSSDAALLKSLRGNMGDEKLNKALGENASELLEKSGREGLVPKKVQVSKDGKTFTQTVYVRPGEEAPASTRIGNTKVPAPDKKHIISKDNNSYGGFTVGQEINTIDGKGTVTGFDKNHMIGWVKVKLDSGKEYQYRMDSTRKLNENSKEDKAEQYKYHPTDRKPKYEHAGDVKNGMSEINRKDFGGNNVFGHSGGMDGYLNLPKLAAATGKKVADDSGKPNEEGMKLLKEMLTRQYGSDGGVKIKSAGQGSVYFTLNHDTLAAGVKGKPKDSTSVKTLDVEKDNISMVMTDHEHSSSDVKKFIKKHGDKIFPNGHQVITVKDMDSEVGGNTTVYVPSNISDVGKLKKRIEKLMGEYIESGDEGKMKNLKIIDAGEQAMNQKKLTPSQIRKVENSIMLGQPGFTFNGHENTWDAVYSEDNAKKAEELLAAMRDKGVEKCGHYENEGTLSIWVVHNKDGT